METDVHASIPVPMAVEKKLYNFTGVIRNNHDRNKQKCYRKTDFKSS
jgi:hypothetical protein